MKLFLQAMTQLMAQTDRSISQRMEGAPDHPSPQGLECAVFESPVLTSLARIEKAEILSLAAKSVAERFGGPRTLISNRH